MAYDQLLAQRVREILARRKGFAAKEMMGGITFLLNGHMCCGVEKDRLMVRVGPERYAEALARPHARPMDFTGRPLKGFVFVDPPGFKTDSGLRQWVLRGVEFVASLPPKKVTVRARAAAAKRVRR